MAGKDQQQECSQQLAADTEAKDLRELHLSATFLTPFSVAPTQDDRAWVSNTQDAYVDHFKQGQGHKKH